MDKKFVQSAVRMVSNNLTQNLKTSLFPGASSRFCVAVCLQFAAWFRQKPNKSAQWKHSAPRRWLSYTQPQLTAVFLHVGRMLFYTDSTLTRGMAFSTPSAVFFSFSSPCIQDVSFTKYKPMRHPSASVSFPHRLSGQTFLLPTSYFRAADTKRRKNGARHY